MFHHTLTVLSPYMEKINNERITSNLVNLKILTETIVSNFCGYHKTEQICKGNLLTAQRLQPNLYFGKFLQHFSNISFNLSLTVASVCGEL